MGADLGDAPVSLWEQETAGTPGLQGRGNVKFFGFHKCLKNKCLGRPCESLGLVGAGVPHTSPKPIMGSLRIGEG